MNPKTIIPSSLETPDVPVGASLEGYDEGEAPPAPSPEVTVYRPPKTTLQRFAIPLTILAILFIIGSMAFIVFTSTRQMTPAEQTKFNQQTVDLSKINDTPITNTSSGQLAVNGGLSVSGSFQVTPKEKPTNPTTGQIFYDKERNALGYYNGSDFVYMQGGTPPPTQNVDNSVSNTTIINNATQLAPPSVLLQQGSPATAQLGNFSVNGTGTVSSIVSDNASINTGDIGNLTSNSATITSGDINTLNSSTATIDTGNITTGNIDTGNIASANIDVGNITTGNITTGNIDVGNIGIVNTTQVDSQGNAFTVNKFAEIPAGQPTSAGEQTLGPDALAIGANVAATKMKIGSTGGPLQSVSVYIKNRPQVCPYGCSSWTPLTMQVGIYSDLNGQPDRRLWYTTVQPADMQDNSWLTVATDNFPLQSSTNYWVAVHAPTAVAYGTQVTFNIGGYANKRANYSCSMGITAGAWFSYNVPSMADPFSAGDVGTGVGCNSNVMNVTLNYVTDPSTGGAGAMFSLDDKGHASFRNTADGSSAFKIQDTNGGTVFNVDTNYGYIGIGTQSPQHTLDINGDVNIANNQPLQFGGRATLTGNATTTTLTGTAITLQGSTTTTGTAAIQGAATFASSVSVTGAATFANTVAVTGATTLNGATAVNNTLVNKVTSPTAFQIQNTSSANLFVADTTNMVVTIKGSDTTFGSLTLTDAHFKSTQTTAPTIAAPTNCGAGATATLTAGSTDTAGSFTITTGTDGTSSTCDTTITFRKAYGAAPKSIIISPRSAVSGQRGIYAAPATTTNFATGFSNSAAGVNSTTYTFSYWVVE